MTSVHTVAEGNQKKTGGYGWIGTDKYLFSQRNKDGPGLKRLTLQA